MPLEIERKFLVKPDHWRSAITQPGRRLVQGYLSRESGRTVRVRIDGDLAFMTVKGAATGQGISRTEIEFPITMADAEAMLVLCHRPLIDKTRYEITHDGMVWELDEFHAENAGLIIAEIELPEENTPFTLPDWVDKEVTLDRRYANSNLTVNPYSTWASE